MNKTAIKTRVVGVEINLDLTLYAIVDIRGDIIAEAELVTSDYPDVNQYVTALCDGIMNLIVAHDCFENIRSVGISAPSGNFQTGCMENSPNMPWKGVIPLAAMMRDRLGMAVSLSNNAHVVALAEHAFGSAHGMNDFVVLTLGHGVGSCFFSNGRAHLGVDGTGGEIGHTCLIPEGRQCGCGHHGCLEAYCSAKGIIRTARELLEKSDKPSLMRGVEHLSPKLITEFCEQGDELAIETYRQTGYKLGWGLSNYASILNPEAIIFTGGVVYAGKWLLDPAYESFEEHVFHNIQNKVKFLNSTLKDSERNVLGASVLAWGVTEYSLFK